VRQAPVCAEASGSSQRAEDVRAGYDPYVFHEVPTTHDSINPNSAVPSELVNVYPRSGDHLGRLSRKMDGRLDSYATEVDNANRFRQVAAAR
jgi:hypothetical protein